jgi:hypothetical protein
MRTVSLQSLRHAMKAQTLWWLRGRDGVDAITATLLILTVVVAVGAYFVHRQHALATAELEQWRVRPLPVIDEPDTVKAQRDIERFMTALPERGGLSDIVSKIFEIAGENNVDLQRADYRLVDDAAAKVIRYQIKYPVKGEPLDIHRFALETLNELPHVGLESLSFRRERSDVTQVEAQIGFVVYVATRAVANAASTDRQSSKSREPARKGQP